METSDIVMEGDGVDTSFMSDVTMTAGHTNPAASTTMGAVSNSLQSQSLQERRTDHQRTNVAKSLQVETNGLEDALSASTAMAAQAQAHHSPDMSGLIAGPERMSGPPVLYLANPKCKNFFPSLVPLSYTSLVCL